MCRSQAISAALIIAISLMLLVTPSSGQFDFAKQAIQGSRDMWKAYSDMREANWKGADKYFHARGNFDAAKRGPGGKWAAEVISNKIDVVPDTEIHNTREFVQGANKPDSIADQEANRWGRNGGDPNKYRPEGLPKKY